MLDRRRQRHRQDDHGRQAGQPAEEGRPPAAHLRGRYVPRRGGRAARDLGEAGRRRHGARARGRRSGGGGVRRHLVGEGQGPRSGAGRYGRTAAHARQPDERARQDPARRVARSARARRRKCCSCSTRRSARTALAQAREFTSVAGVNGIVLTKLDGTAKGGVAVAIANDLKLPIRYVGVGEGIDDLVPFSARGIRRRAVRREVVATGDGRADRSRLHGPRAVSRRARPRADEPESRWSARSSCRATAWSSGRAITSAPARRTPRCCALDDGRGPRARRHAVLHARAVLPRGTHRPVRRPDRRGRHRARRGGRR